jgi:hypothetical protein
MTLQRPSISIALLSLLLAMASMAGCDNGTPNGAAPAAQAQPASNTAAATPTSDRAGTFVPTSAGAMMSFTKQRHDFGLVEDGATRTCTFPFTNTGSETLVISEIKPSCGCTTTTLEKMTYAPGEGAEIDVSFSPTGQGVQAKNITIVSNSGDASVKQIWISANMKPTIVVEPTYLRFGSVALGEAHTMTATVRAAYPTLEIRTVDTPNSFVSISDSRRISPSEHAITFRLNNDVGWGGFYTMTTVEAAATNPTTGEQFVLTLPVYLSASVYGNVHASDTMFRVGATPLATNFQKTIRMTNPARQPFRIVSAVIENPSFNGMTLEVRPIMMGNVVGHDLVLNGTVGTYQGPVNGAVLITTDVVGEEQLRIPIAGIVRAMQPAGANTTNSTGPALR